MSRIISPSYGYQICFQCNGTGEHLHLLHGAVVDEVCEVCNGKGEIVIDSFSKDINKKQKEIK